MDEQQRTKSESGAVAREADLEPTYTDKAGNVIKKRILTGDRTTGKLHLGHYVGSLRNRLKYQSSYDTFILMADVQALTTHWENPKILKESVREVALDYMAAGLNPYTGGADDQTRAKIVVQSHVPAIAELTVLYGLVTQMSIVLDNPTTKSEAQQYGMGSEDTNIAEASRILNELSSEYKTGLEEAAELLQTKYPEIGEFKIEVLHLASIAAIESPDVSLREAMKDIPEDKLWDTDLLQLPEWLKFVRDQIITIKRSTGIRQMTYGFLGYPVSQAADITFVNAHLVPVGEDQVPHIELTREIARRMNKQYGGRRRILVEPQALIGGATIKGLDGNAKMSKSLGNAVYLSDSDQDIWSKVKKAVTDPQRVRKDDPGRPEICTIFAYHQQFNETTEPSIAAADLNVPTVEETAEMCRTAGIGCVECKKNLAAKLKALLDPMRERRAKWENDIPGLMDILKAGTVRGNEEGNATVDRVKSAMHVDYWK